MRGGRTFERRRWKLLVPSFALFLERCANIAGAHIIYLHIYIYNMCAPVLKSLESNITSSESSFGMRVVALHANSPSENVR